MKTVLDRPPPSAGFALILVMVTIIVLTSLVATFSLSMNTEVRLARNADYDVELEWMGRSGVELARFALANKCQEQRNIDSLNQFWAGGSAPCSNDIPQFSLKDYHLGQGQFSVTIEDMERKWSINRLVNPGAPQRDVLQKALAVMGVTDAGLAETIENSILDWCSPPNGPAGFSGAKDDYYMHLPIPYYCKNGPIDDLSELLLVKGITPDIYWGSFSSNHPLSAFQQHGGGAFDQPAARGGLFRNDNQPVYPVGLEQLFSPMGGKLNINTASALTLQLIPGMDEATAQRIIQQRAGPDGVDGTDDDMPFQNIGEINGGFGGGGPANIPGGPPMGAATMALNNYIDVRSYVFKVRVDAEINGYKRTFYGIVSRAGFGAQQTRCVKFYWD
jgi:general secretion pathway protein K